MDSNQEPYMLGHRKGNIDEDRRLDTQHELIKDGILGSYNIHPSIPLHKIKNAIADVGTGTGVWLNDVARGLQTLSALSSVRLVGFDVTDARFSENPEPGVEFLVHDATKPFPPQFYGQFDLVNVRLLVYAIPEQNFRSVAENVAQLLRQWSSCGKH